MVISEADRQIVIFRNGEPIGRARFEMQGSYHFPTAVFSYLGRENNQNRWLGIGRDAEETEKITSDKTEHMAMHKGAALKKLSQKKPASRRYKLL
jgi:hypothetical protein